MYNMYENNHVNTHINEEKWRTQTLVHKMRSFQQFSAECDKDNRIGGLSSIYHFIQLGRENHTR